MPFENKKEEMSDWCKDLRANNDHLVWMGNSIEREKKINEIEKRFRCFWEDKFKEVCESYNSETAAKAINLDIFNFRIWAEHLGLNLNYKTPRKVNINRNYKSIKKKCLIPSCKVHPHKGQYCSIHKNIGDNLKISLNETLGGVKQFLFLICPRILNKEILSLRGEEIIEIIRHVLVEFNEREVFILENRYLIEDSSKRKTLEEIGLLFSITRERVRQIEALAIRKMRHPKVQNVLIKYFIDKLIKNNDQTNFELMVRIDALQKEVDSLKQQVKNL